MISFEAFKYDMAERRPAGGGAPTWARRGRLADNDQSVLTCGYLPRL